MNNNVGQKFTSLKWEAMNIYFIMPARRHFYPPSFFSPFFWRSGGLEGLTPLI
jgi:hypothetical protein